MSGPARVTITEPARRWLLARGGAVTLRYSPRHGCCGGEAAVPVAEPRRPDHPEHYICLPLDGVELYLAEGIGPDETITLSLEGFWRWQHLYVEGLGMRSRKDV